MYKAVTRRNAEYTLMNADATYRVPDKDPTSGHPDLHTLHTKPRGRKFAFSPAVGRMGRIVCGAHGRHDAAGRGEHETMAETLVLGVCSLSIRRTEAV